MKEAAAVATILAEKMILPQPAVTGMDSEIAEKSVVVCAVVGVATAAAEAVAVALAAAKTGNCNNGAVLGGNTTGGLISDR